MMKRLTITACVALALYSAPLIAQDGLPDIPVDSRMKLLMYDESDIYTITTKYGYQTHIVFDAREEINTISIGDRSMWQIIPAGNRLFIRPMNENVSTNMTIITNKRSYQFDLKSLPIDSSEMPLYVARFIYDLGAYQHAAAVHKQTVQAEEKPVPSTIVEAPVAAPVVLMPETKIEPTVKEPEPIAIATIPSVEPEKETAPTVKVAETAKTMDTAKARATQGKPNYNYTYTGPDNLAPVKVYDDGAFTYIHYAALKEPLPKIFSMENGVKKEQAFYYLKDGYIVIESVAREWKVQFNDGTVTIYNEVLNPQ